MMLNKSMRRIQRILTTFGIIIVLVLIFYFISDTITKHTGFFVSSEIRETEFEKCLKEQDITLFINTDNPTLTLKSIKTFDALKDIRIFNCLRDNKFCLENEIKSFPTWKINNKKFEKDISMAELSRISGCELL